MITITQSIQRAFSHCVVMVGILGTLFVNGCTNHTANRVAVDPRIQAIRTHYKRKQVTLACALSRRGLTLSQWIRASDELDAREKQEFVRLGR